MATINQDQLASSKCDFRFDFGKLKFSGQQIGTTTTWSSIGPGEKLQVQSDKCDWRISAQREEAKASIQHNLGTFSLTGQKNDFEGRLSADKCDYQLSIERLGSHLKMESDKCDFRINSTIERVQPVHINTLGPGANVRVFSSKCDWKVNALGASQKLTKRPNLNASLSSDKCDFRLNIEFGLLGGKTIRINAVSSGKCDFRILDEREERETNE
jgi:hypothetical protein